MNLSHKDLLQALEKAVHSGNITAVVPEDLEIEAHNTLWQESEPGELTLLKMMPTVPATSVAHEFTKITSYGHARPSSTGFFGERTLPPETNFGSERVVKNIKLMGEIGPTFILAALEKTQKALGTQGAQNIERVALRRNVLWKKNRNLYFSDTNNVRLGANGTRFEGLAQQIREGTDGTTGTSPFGSHAIDMEGLPLTIQTIREKAAQVITQFGRLRCLLMDPFARQDLEESMDSAQRLPLGISASAYMLGQNIAGLQTQGSVIWFETDNSLSPMHAFGQYSTDLIDGAPATTPTVATPVAGAPGGGRTSKWNAADAGSYFWVITEVVDEREGLGVQSSTIAVAAGQEVTLTITPGNPLADSFRVYRGASGDAVTDAWFIFEVAGSGGGAVTAYDDNLYRPNTSYAFALNLHSKAERALHNGVADSYFQARDRASEFLGMPDMPGNTIAEACLGPRMGIMALASILAEVDRPLMYSACVPEVRNPFQNLYFYNIGRS